MDGKGNCQILVSMKKGIVRISVSSKILFLYVVIKTPLQIILGSSVQGDLILPVLIDNCVVLLVDVYVISILNGVLKMITLKE